MLRWHEDNSDTIGQSVKLNADCMLHAALEEDREMLAILYSFGYRLGLLHTVCRKECGNLIMLPF